MIPVPEVQRVASYIISRDLSIPLSHTLLREYNISPVSILFLFPFVKDVCTVGRMIFIVVIIPVALLYISLYRKYHSPYTHTLPSELHEIRYFHNIPLSSC
jgi:hypothetical protein